MKRIITTIICILLSLYGLEVYAQKTTIQESDRNTMGTITSKEFSIRVDERASFADFSVKVPEGGDYYVSFWLLPSQHPDKSYSKFNVYVNGKSVGTIHPSKENWQSLGLDGKQMISLKKGENTISLSSPLPDIVSVEVVRVARSLESSNISDVNYKNYLDKIDLVSRGVKSSEEIISQEEKEYLSIVNKQSPTAFSDGSAWDVRFFYRLPIKYSFRKLRYYEEGSEIRIITNSTDQHVIDVFYTDRGSLSNYDPTYQHLSWLVPSFLSSSSGQSFYISMKTIKVPKKGYYTIKARSLSNNKLGSINIYIDNDYYNNQPLFTTHKSLSMPTDGQHHILMTQKQDTILYNDPILYVEGGGSCPGKIVAYNDDKRPFEGADTVINHMFPNHFRDAVVKAKYLMPTCGFHIQNWYSSSGSQSGFCNVIYLKTKPQRYIPYPYPRVPFDTPEENNTPSLSVNICSEQGVLSIESNKELHSVSVYNKMGVLVGTRKLGAKQITIPPYELGMNSQDVYLLVFQAQDGEIFNGKIFHRIN